LRAVFFLLAAMLDRFHYLKPGVALILIFVGLKMLAAIVSLQLSIGVSLAVVVGILAVAVAASIRHATAETNRHPNAS
jgi:tellurite resistance protein TerC